MYRLKALEPPSFAQKAMGKKTKSNKKNKGANKSKPPSSTDSRRRRQEESNHLANQASLYAIYKYCTQRVIEWGKIAYCKLKQKEQKKGTKKASGKPSDADDTLLLESSLSRIIFQCLGTVAAAGIPIPEHIFKDLKTAISYRKRVADYYGNIPHIPPEAISSHEWLIVQLERLEAIFSQNVQQNSTRKEEKHVETGFSVLSLHHDEDSVDDEDHAEEAHTALSTTKTTTTVEKKKEKLPTDAALRDEERFFAIALLLSQIAEGRMKLQEVWKQWADKGDGVLTDEDDSAGLLAATSATEYTLHSFSKTILQARLEFGDNVFDEILKAQDPMLMAKHTTDTSSITLQDCVSIQNLQSRSDLNGRHGRVTKVLESEGRVAVQLFPEDPTEYQNTNNWNNAVTLSVKRENLLLSDHLCRRLGQVHEALQLTPWNSIPEPPKLVINSPMSTALGKSSEDLTMHFFEIQEALKQKDFLGFLRLTVQWALPIWISMARYILDMGAANSVVTSFLREFDKTRHVDFQLALSMIVIVDCALTVYNVGHERATDSLDIVDRTLTRSFEPKTYASAIRLLKRYDYKSAALYSHMEFARHLRGEYLIMCSEVPLLSGIILSDGLRMDFVCSSGLPYSFVEEFTNMLHLYWMLRTEGFLGRVPEIEDTLIAMYRQQVWFRAGLPQRGREAYVKSWQLSLGAVNANSARLLDGRATQRKGTRQTALPKDMEMTGLHVTEISRLRDILQWKTMPLADVSFCHDQIQSIAREEYFSIYTAPLMSCSIKMMQAHERLGSSPWVERAMASGRKMVQNFDVLTHQMKPTPKVCFWAFALGDNRSLNSAEKPQMLQQLADDIFRTIFTEEASSNSARMTHSEDDEPVTLTFSSYTHEVNRSLWGQRGSESLAHR